MHEIETTRLFLRRLQLTDDESLQHTIFGDPEVMRFGDGIQSIEWTRKWIRTRLEDDYPFHGYGPYAVVEKAGNNLLGYCGLFHFPDVNGKPEIEIGYRLARNAWGNGFATESARAVRDFAFCSLGIQRIIAIIDPSNIASIHVAEKIGMHYEQDVLFEGYSYPDHVYVVIRL